MQQDSAEHSNNSFVDMRCTICVYLCVKSVCAPLGCQLMSCWSLEKWRLWNSEEAVMIPAVTAEALQSKSYLSLHLQMTVCWRTFRILKSPNVQGRTLHIKHISVWIKGLTVEVRLLFRKISLEELQTNPESIDKASTKNLCWYRNFILIMKLLL